MAPVCGDNSQVLYCRGIDSELYRPRRAVFNGCGALRTADVGQLTLILTRRAGNIPDGAWMGRTRGRGRAAPRACRRSRRERRGHGPSPANRERSGRRGRAGVVAGRRRTRAGRNPPAARAAGRLRDARRHRARGARPLARTAAAQRGLGNARPVAALVTRVPRANARWCVPQRLRDGASAGREHCVPRDEGGADGGAGVDDLDRTRPGDGEQQGEVCDIAALPAQRTPRQRAGDDEQGRQHGGLAQTGPAGSAGDCHQRSEQEDEGGGDDDGSPARVVPRAADRADGVVAALLMTRDDCCLCTRARLVRERRRALRWRRHGFG